MFSECKKSGHVLVARFALVAKKANIPKESSKKYFTEEREMVYDGKAHALYRI